MRVLAVVTVLFAAAALSACSSISVSTDWDRAANFAPLRTYAWLPPAADARPPFGGNTILEKRVVATVERELGLRGITRTDASPSFLVASHALTREHLDV